MHDFAAFVGWLTITAAVVIGAMVAIGKIKFGRMTEEELRAEMKRIDEEDERRG